MVSLCKQLAVPDVRRPENKTIRDNNRDTRRIFELAVSASNVKLQERMLKIILHDLQSSRSQFSRISLRHRYATPCHIHYYRVAARSYAAFTWKVRAFAWGVYMS